MQSTASGALSSQDNYKPTEDTGKYVGTGGQTGDGGYRMTNTAIGPESSHTGYNPTEDVGKYQPASNNARLADLRHDRRSPYCQRIGQWSSCWK